MNIKTKAIYGVAEKELIKYLYLQTCFTYACISSS